MKRKSMRTAVGIAAICMAVMTASPAAVVWGKTAPTAAAAETKTAYAFKSGETVMSLNQEAAPVIKALGAYKKCFEQQSCAYQGMDKIYTYSGFELGTYPVKGKDCISSIYFTDSTVSTQEGIKIGSTYDDMIKAYGDGYKEEYGVYRYTLGDSELSIYTTKKIVDAIEYQVITK